MWPTLSGNVPLAGDWSTAAAHHFRELIFPSIELCNHGDKDSTTSSTKSQPSREQLTINQELKFFLKIVFTKDRNSILDAQYLVCLFLATANCQLVLF